MDTKKVVVIYTLPIEECGTDMIPGGLADKRVDANPEQLEMGQDVEMEHTNVPDIAEEIAEDHLKEHSDYYTVLKQVGL